MWQYNFIEHTADLGVEIKSDSLPELFEAAVVIMFDNLIEISKITPQKLFKLKVKGNSCEEMLFNLLKKLLEDFYIKGIAFAKVESLNIKRNKAIIKFWGDIITDSKYPRDIFKYEIKTITYHNLKIEKIGSQYKTVIIFDI